MSDNSMTPRELSIRVFFFGVILAMVLSAANAYLGLFAGMTVSAAIPAAVMALGLMRFFRGSTIYECNLIGTCASAGESLAAGVIFTLPALLLLGFWEQFSYLWVAVIAGFGGLLGTLFTIPLRRSLIVETKLQFPEGVATAKVLETGRKDTAGIKFIAKAALAAGLFKVGATGLGIWPEIMQGAARVRRSVAYFGSNLSPALLAVGFIVGLNIAVLIFIGGAANWLLTIPIVAHLSNWPTYAAGHAQAGQTMSSVDYAYEIWSTKTRYIGVGGMLLGGLWTIFHMRKSLVSGMASGLQAYRQIKDGGGKIDRTERDLPMQWILFMIVGSVIPLFFVYLHFVQHTSISAVMALIMLGAGFLFAAVAAYMAGLVGSSNNPISGVTVSTVLVASLLLLALMGRSEGGPAAAIIVGSVICCAAAIAGDVMQDLRCGRIVGTTPWKQQVMEMVGTASAALVIAPVLILLQRAYGFAGMKGAGEKALSSPQANLMASVAKGVFAGSGEGGLPWVYIGIGMGVAVLIIALDLFLQAREYPFRTPILAIAIGFYLPFQLSVPIFVGGLISYAVKWYHRRNSSSTPAAEASERRGLLMASGLITGEALMGILVAVPIVLLKGTRFELPLFEGMVPFGGLLGVILLILVTGWLYRTAVKEPPAKPTPTPEATP
jgi:putative OPT family oligopeptide transporter